MKKCDFESVSRILDSGEIIDLDGQKIEVKAHAKDFLIITPLGASVEVK